MKSHWHEQIQLHMDGQSSAAESAALSEALSQDAELRALYLDYMNLNAALSAMAIAVHGDAKPTTLLHSTRRWSSSYWRWFASAAACLALVLIGVLSETRDAVRAHPGIGAVTVSARTSISQLRADLPRPLPLWMSPTASLLNEPAYPR
jgi:anti-sigma factor RsiW